MPTYLILALGRDRARVLTDRVQEPVDSGSAFIVVSSLRLKPRHSRGSQARRCLELLKVGVDCPQHLSKGIGRLPAHVLQVCFLPLHPLSSSPLHPPGDAFHSLSGM
jgi:hypothetical protein